MPGGPCIGCPPGGPCIGCSPGGPIGPLPACALMSPARCCACDVLLCMGSPRWRLSHGTRPTRTTTMACYGNAMITSEREEQPQFVSAALSAAFRWHTILHVRLEPRVRIATVATNRLVLARWPWCICRSWHKRHVNRKQCIKVVCSTLLLLRRVRLILHRPFERRLHTWCTARCAPLPSPPPPSSRERSSPPFSENENVVFLCLLFLRVFATMTSDTLDVR